MGRPTRWEQTNNERYGARFDALLAAGEDIVGEARLADALVSRHSRILDAGSGMGRIGAHLRAAGHDAYGIDLDQRLLEQSRNCFPDFPAAPGRLDEVTSADLRSLGFPTEFDLIVCVGNVMILLAPDSEVDVLRNFRTMLARGGRVLLGFSTDGAPPDSRIYSVAQCEADAGTAGLRVESRFASYDLRPATDADAFAVLLLAATEN